ncbi:MAG: hypothetical protein ACFFE2_04115 [Candidatus Thorarchaeota archaeon]
MGIYEALIFVIIVFSGMVLVFIPIVVQFSLRGNGKTIKLPLRLYFKNPRKYSFYCAVCGAVGIGLIAGTSSIYQFYDGNYTMCLLLLIAAVIGMPFSAWRIYYNLINLNISSSNSSGF